MILQSTIYKKISCKLTKVTSNSVPKRFMLTLRKLYPTMSLMPKTTPKIIARYPSFVAEGTLLTNKDYCDIRKFLYYHNKYLSNLDFSQDIDFQTFVFYEENLFIQPKYGQHIMSVTYSEAKYATDKLVKCCPNVNIHGGAENLFVTEDVVTTAIAANKIMKQKTIFQNGHLTVIACDPKTGKEVTNKIAVAQTKQEHPDYYYVYKESPNDKNSGYWCRYYDLKTGSFCINTGHIICISNKEEYEKKVAHHLHAQYELYKKEPDIRDAFKNVIDNPKLTWSDRNIKMQEFYRDNLHKYPHINPSFILYNPLLYEIDNQSIPKNVNNFVIESSLESVENTQELMAKSIYSGGKMCYENYLKHPYKSPIIVGLIKGMINNSSSS